jgi:hypothetical protein
MGGHWKVAVDQLAHTKEWIKEWSYFPNILKICLKDAYESLD